MNGSPRTYCQVPVIVLAHGLGGLQSSRLQPFAEAFAAEGYHAITFDYRYWGESAGEPRNLIDVTTQQDDYKAALGAAKSLPGIDSSRLVIWGTSLSGGHVLELGASLPPGTLAAVIAQAPHVNGAATIAALPPASLPELIVQATADATIGRIGGPIYIPIANFTGSYGALTQPGAVEGYAFVQPNPPPPGNVFAARFILQFPTFSPDWTAANSVTPTFIGVAESDNVTPPEPSIDLAKSMKTATLKTYPGGHFDVYPGAKSYAANLRDQIAFLKAVVPI